MRSIAVILALLGAASFSSAEPWSDFKQRFGVKFSADEEALRKDIFHTNLRSIDAHNAAGHSWTKAVNQFAHLTPAEFKSTYLGGWRGPSKSVNSVDTSLLRVKSVDLPKAVDWVKKGAVTYVKNQGQCGSCWAFSTTGAVEGVHAIHRHRLVAMSEQQLMDCSGRFGNQGCNGGLMDNAFRYIIETGGLCSEEAYPYEGRDTRCHSCDPVAKISGFHDVPEDNEGALKAAVAKQPVSVSIEANQHCFQFYSGGVLDCECGTALDHGVLAVGYGEERGKDFWLVKNSWGASWGDHGYVKMLRGGRAGRAGMCGIQRSPSYPTM